MTNGIGLSEVFLILLLMLLLFKPEDLPAIVRTVARALGKLRKQLDATREMLDEVARLEPEERGDLRAEAPSKIGEGDGPTDRNAE